MGWVFPFFPDGVGVLFGVSVRNGWSDHSGVVLVLQLVGGERTERHSWLDRAGTKVLADGVDPAWWRWMCARLDLIVVRAMTRPQFWLCQCDCGEEVGVQEDMLLSGAARSCKGAKAHETASAVTEPAPAVEPTPVRTKRAHLSVVS